MALKNRTRPKNNTHQLAQHDKKVKQNKASHPFYFKILLMTYSLK